MGDYIDLVSLTIAADAGGGGVALNSPANSTLLRLIVVGINTFRENPSSTHTGSYATNGSEAAPHLVFQFKNTPVRHNMNVADSNVGGYAASELRTYLIGNFSTGLRNAGVPMDDTSIVWAPKRYVATGRDSQPGVSAGLIEDKLWLPTERELVGANGLSSSAFETAENQARLAYYADDASRVKGGVGMYYGWWTASTYAITNKFFARVDGLGTVSAANAPVSQGTAPAFCVR
jgi:hypothetical protein